MDNTVKFPVKVYKEYEGDILGSDYYDMTEKELEDKCCVYNGMLFFRDAIPNDVMLIDVTYATLYDIWNYECVAWWEWPDHLKQIMYEKVPKSKN